MYITEQNDFSPVSKEVKRTNEYNSWFENTQEQDVDFLPASKEKQMVRTNENNDWFKDTEKESEGNPFQSEKSMKKESYKWWD